MILSFSYHEKNGCCSQFSKQKGKRKKNITAKSVQETPSHSLYLSLSSPFEILSHTRFVSISSSTTTSCFPEKNVTVSSYFEVVSVICMASHPLAVGCSLSQSPSSSSSSSSSPCHLLLYVTCRTPMPRTKHHSVRFKQPPPSSSRRPNSKSPLRLSPLAHLHRSVAIYFSPPRNHLPLSLRG